MSLSSNNDIVQLQIPTLDEILERVLNDILASLSPSNPFINQQFIKITGAVFAGEMYQLYVELQQLLKQFFLTTQSGNLSSEALDAWGALFGFIRLSGTQSIGNVNFEGVAGTVIPQGTLLQSLEGNIYTVDSDATVTTITATGLNGNISGTTISIVYANHGLATGGTVQVTGSTESQINGNHQITVIDNNSFSYDITTVLPPGAITGLTVIVTIAITSITSQDTGSDQNIGQGPQISLQTQIAGISNSGQGYIPFGEIKGGADEETNDELQSRVVRRLQNPIAQFSETSIKEQIFNLNLSMVTTVISPFEVSPTPPSPAPGQVVIIIVIKEDDNTIRNPTTTELQLAKQAVAEITPANNISPVVSDANVYVREPVALFDVDIVISNLEPGDTSMEEAITNNLEVFFADNVKVSRGDPNLASTNFITMNQITTVIGSTIDTVTGIAPIEFNFTLNGGIIDITIPIQNRPILNSVTFI